MTESAIYWITRLDEIKSFFLGLQTLMSVLAGISLTLLIICMILKNVEESSSGTDTDDYRSLFAICKHARIIFIPTFCIALMCSVARTFIPATREMVAIKVIPQVASVESVEKIKDISKDFVDVTAAWLDELKSRKLGGSKKKEK